jgi:hypothetical protein
MVGAGDVAGAAAEEAEESVVVEDGAGGVALSGIAGVVCAGVVCTAVVGAAAGGCGGTTVVTVASDGVDAAGAGSGGAGLSLSSSGVIGRDG